MKGNFSSSDKLELDLSFASLSVDELEINVDDQTINLMKNSCLWSVDIANWISFIQSDQELQCHTVIRNARKISLGLELTNDNKISELNQNWRGQFKSTDVLSFPIIDGLSFFYVLIDVFKTCFDFLVVFVKPLDLLVDFFRYNFDILDDFPVV